MVCHLRMSHKSCCCDTTDLDLIIWISVRPVPDDVPVEGLRVAGITSDVLDCFVVNVQVTFRY